MRFLRVVTSPARRCAGSIDGGVSGVCARPRTPWSPEARLGFPLVTKVGLSVTKKCWQLSVAELRTLLQVSTTILVSIPLDWMPFADSTAADQTFANSYAPIWHLPIKTKTAANQTCANNFSYDIGQSWHQPICENLLMIRQKPMLTFANLTKANHDLCQ